MAKRISKSRYLSGLQCEKRIWLEYNRPAEATPISKAQKRTFDQGTEVGILAQADFPDGLLIKADPADLDKNVAEAKAAIESGAVTIFEATFFFDDTYALADIITKNDDNSWNLYEVKASTSVKDIHYPDLALQAYVMEGTGLSVDKIFVKHINKQYVHPAPLNLFTTADVTAEVRELSPEVSPYLERFHSLIQQASEPDILIGPHCTSPYLCPFKKYCWQPYGDHTVFDIPRISAAKQTELREQGIIKLKDLPDDYPLSDTQREYVARMLIPQRAIDIASIKSELATLKYPLYFLDFETDNAAIPRFDGTSPYEQLPFQYSCHIMQEDGRVEHHEYLHLDESDPRFPLTQALLADIGASGSVIAYNVSFERRVLNKLAETFPGDAAQLRSIANRLWDQLDIFRKHFKCSDFGNSNSIKNVLPVLVPGLAYDNLEVQNGADAQAVWHEMINENSDSKNSKRAEELAKDLIEYCKLDTLAMVEIHKALLQEIDAGSA